VPTPLRVLGSALLLVALAAGPAAAAPDGDEVVGGARLGSDGVVVDAYAPDLPEGLTAASWLVADLDSGQVLAAKDPHGQYAPASTLKTLTALTLIPVLDRDRTVVPTFDDINVEGSKVGLVEQVRYPVHELFSALMMVSGNDAANVLASAVGGPEAAALLMNEKARSLGAFDTQAVNQHGLDAEGQVSSAYDLALIARAGMAEPEFAAYAAAVRGSVSAPGGARIEMHTKNKLLKSYDGALGIKNGYTSQARASFMGAAEREGRRLVVTLMRADPKVADEAMTLLDWGFEAAGVARPVGRLVDPEPADEPVVAEDAGSDAGTALAASPAAADVPAEGSGLPVTLAGLGLAAAAVLTVRRRPEPPRPTVAGAGGRSVPAQRPVVHRPSPRPSSPPGTQRPVPQPAALRRSS
jgi:D-alanyl-D-alanine carboxypeptidase (penicillin-binding protein 5/6)